MGSMSQKADAQVAVVVGEFTVAERANRCLERLDSIEATLEPGTARSMDAMVLRCHLQALTEEPS